MRLHLWYLAEIVFWFLTPKIWSMWGSFAGYFTQAHLFSLLRHHFLFIQHDLAPWDHNIGAVSPELCYKCKLRKILLSDNVLFLRIYREFWIDPHNASERNHIVKTSGNIEWSRQVSIDKNIFKCTQQRDIRNIFLRAQENSREEWANKKIIIRLGSSG